ncbi:Wzz/FepE/Etk N-terminal domain-containing protein [Parabacteroides sp. APC149_11_2_Y6]
MEAKQVNVLNKNSLQEIDLVELFQVLWKKRFFLLKCCGVAFVIGLVIAFSIPKKYETKAKLAPESTDLSKSMGSLGGLAAIAGINMKQGVGADAISPDLYPDVVKSTPFLLELFPIKVTTMDKKLSISLYDYILQYQRKAWWSYVVGAPFKLIGWTLGLLSEKPEKKQELNAYLLTSEQAGVIAMLQQLITVKIDKKTSTLEVSVRMQDPLISADVTCIVMDKLQKYMTDYRIHKVKQDMEYTQKVFGEARGAYYKAQKAYAAFEDANKNIISASYRTEQERLKNEMTLTFNVYNSLAQKLEQDKLRVQEETPVYTVIEPATVPLRAASPKKLLILAACVFLALFGGCGYVLIKNFFAVKKI